MSTKPESGKYLFVPKEGGMPHGQWCVMMEPQGSSIRIFEENTLALDLREPTYENARALADTLNMLVERLNLTPLPPKQR